MLKSIIAGLVGLFMAGLTFCQSPEPLLLQSPTVSQTQIAFSYGGDLWIVSREGGSARRLVTGTDMEGSPIFSPDGKFVAYTANYDGNLDVYLAPATGGEPRRLTYHPGADVAVGWTPDGKSVLFRSPRDSYSMFGRLFTVSREGGFPTEIPLPMAETGSFSPDGSHLAYVPNGKWQPAWKTYRGGQTTPIWIANLADSSVEEIPRNNSNDSDPMWVGNKIYFLSDREGPITLFSYDLTTKKVTEEVPNHGLDIKSASAGPGAIVYEQFGSLHLFDLRTHKSTALNITVSGDMPQVRPHFENVSKQIRNESISPTGARAVFEAHGEILTVPAEKGDIRDITHTPGVEERYPAWSPDGKWIAYFSDESGEYALHLRDQSGMGLERKFNLGNPPSFFYSPSWSPDSKKIAYTDKRLNLWYIDLGNGKPVKIDTDTYESPARTLDPAWSPDSRWIVYTKQLQSHLHAVFVYSLETGRSTQITDGMSDARFPQFDRSGKYIFFTASTDLGLSTGWLDMTSYQHPITRSVYVMVLRKDLPSPIPPESDEEKVKEAGKTNGEEAAKSPEEKPKAKEKEPVKVEIDFDHISQRILTLPIAAENYQAAFAGTEGVLYLVEGPVVQYRMGPPIFTVRRFDLKTRKTRKILEGVNAFDLSENGEKMLYRKMNHWYIAPSKEAPKPTEAALKTDSMEVYVVPREEWRQMYHEVWRIERDFLYDPGHHGLDIPLAEKAYSKYLDGIASRDDLTYLFQEMTGNISVGHTFVRGGEEPKVEPIQVGLLGADYKIENGRYRFVRIFNGENWNPQLRAPLTQPGVNVTVGEYLLAVNGRELHGTDDIYSFFQETAGKQVTLKVGPNPDDKGSREAVVVPVASEMGLRNLAWIEGNRRKVDEMSQGKLAYVYLPNTGGGGYTNFNRYYFAQVGKEGAVIDERFNTGGSAADYIIEYLNRPLMNYWDTRQGDFFTTPLDAIFGPKVMIINQMCGSGGDALPWYFRHEHVGTLVGVRTWGGLVGIYDYPILMDGGTVTAPRVAFFNTEGQWDVENHGVPPDIQVPFDPKLWREGHDPQLERAVQTALDELKKSPLPEPHRPPYPVYHHPLPTIAK